MYPGIVAIYMKHRHRHREEVLVAEAFVYVILQQEKEKGDKSHVIAKTQKEKSNHTTQKSKSGTQAPKKHSPPMARGSFLSNGQFAFEGGVASLSNVRRWARLQAKQKGKRKGETPKFPGKVS